MDSAIQNNRQKAKDNIARISPLVTEELLNACMKKPNPEKLSLLSNRPAELFDRSEMEFISRPEPSLLLTCRQIAETPVQRDFNSVVYKTDLRLKGDPSTDGRLSVWCRFALQDGTVKLASQGYWSDGDEADNTLLHCE